MGTRYGTSHFKSFEAAFQYYKDYGYVYGDVQRKIQDGEIHIGKPTLKPGERCSLNDEGRYVIEEA
jgi:hypothetical protein